MTITRAEIQTTFTAIQPYVRVTPVIEIDGREFGINATLVLKLEQLQHSGSFKARGAFANLLLRQLPPAGVVAASGGNHGSAVAYAAMKLGVRATIFVPTISPAAKLDRIRSYAAELVIKGDRYAESLAASREFAAKSGALEVHAYDQRETLLGQGTLAIELEQQSPQLDSVLVAVGGGGLIGGIAAWYENRARIISVEPEAAPTLARALEAGHPVDVEVGGIAADSLGARRVGDLMFPIAQQYVTALLVTDEAIADAQKILWDALRIVAEPGGATAFAALLSGRYTPQPGERVGVIICGANTNIQLNAGK